MNDVDLLVLGSGIAGLTAAVRAAERGLRVGVITKGTIAQTATGWAQGGVAAVLGQIAEDSTDQHMVDTLRAGAGLCDEAAVRVLVDDGPERVRDLIELGAQFDRDPDGSLQLAREGGHSHARVVHAGGAATGAEIERALVAATERTAAVVHEHTFASELLVEGGACRGAVVMHADGSAGFVRAANVLLATGGAGQLFAVTTNPPEATGDGIAMALRAGVAVADAEFVQFHPTALAIDRSPRPLLTEALRGHGALLRNADGERFVDELKPRDIVARAILHQSMEDGRDHVWLDVRPIDDFAKRYPTLAKVLEDVGLDPRHDLLPVAPAAHYFCGGVLTDLHGATTLPGLWAAGEVANCGVHGANRLASNSLLDGLVFGARVVDRVLAGVNGPTATGPMAGLLTRDPAIPVSPLRMPRSETSRRVTRADLQRAMTEHASVLRDAASLANAAKVVEATGHDPETENLCVISRALCAAASAREESRGAHARRDFPATADRYRVRYAIGG